MSTDQTTGRLGGWLFEQEDFDYLYALPLSPTEFLCANMAEPPKSVDPRSWLQIEDQRQVGACQGHALSTAVELAYFYEAGKPIQLNRMFAYVVSQRKDNIRGDSGSTISGGERTAKEDGLPLESTWPYTGQYTTNIPQQCFVEAKEYRVKTSVRIQSYADTLAFLQAGIGGINIGMNWTLRDAPVQESYTRGSGGGHAVGLVGYNGERLDSSGKPYIILANSWSKRWGANGFTELSPKCVDQIFQHPHTVAVGVSDMEKIEPRRIKHLFL